MMLNKALSFLRKQKNLFSKGYSLSTPDSKQFDATVRQMMKQTENVTIFFQIVRRGLNQSDSVLTNTFGFRRCNWMDWFITINCLINVIRCGVLSLNTSESIAVYLGDPLFRVKGGQALLLWCSLATIVMYLFREWILTLEAKGKFAVLSVWSICSNGFNPTELKMNKENAKKFRFTVYLISLTIYWVLLVIPLFCTFLYLSLILTNDWMYEIPKLFFFALVWSISFIFSFAILFNAIIGFGWYIMCALYFHLYRLRDLVDCADLLLENSKHCLSSEKDIGLFCSFIIDHLNAFEIASHKLRYVLLCYFSVVASACNFDIFLGSIIRVYSRLFCNLLTISGLSVLLSVALFGLTFGSFITQLGNLVIRLHQLSCRSKYPIASFSKVLEIMDRAGGPYNGLKIGDFVTLEKQFFILFIVENISALMLFTINIGPLIL